MECVYRDKKMTHFLDSNIKGSFELSVQSAAFNLYLYHAYTILNIYHKLAHESSCSQAQSIGVSL